MKHLTIIIIIMFFGKYVSAQTEIILRYDTVSKTKLLPPSSLDYKKGDYLFKITNVNSAFHTGGFSPEFLNKVSVIPAVLSGIIPTNSPTTSHEKISLSPVIRVSPEQRNFISELVYDYDYINGLITQSKTLIGFVKNNWRDIVICHGKAIDIMHDLNVVGKPLNVKLSQNGDNRIIISKPIEEIILDFLSRVQIIKSNPEFLKNIPIEDLNSIYKAEDFVKMNHLAIIKSLAVIDEVVNCVDYIKTKKYSISSDYFRLNVDLLQGRLTGTPDTVLNQKIVFYRKSYMKLIDITSGFFLNNLYNRSYYYKDTLGQINSENKSRMDLSVGALAHSYFVVKSNLKLGLSLGAAVSLLDGKPKYLGGGSIIFGRNKELAISFGAALASLSKPSLVLKNGQPFSLKNTTGSVPVANKISWGYFTGISYSFLKL